MKEIDYQNNNIRSQLDILNAPDFFEKIKTFTYNSNKEYKQRGYDGYDESMNSRLNSSGLEEKLNQYDEFYFFEQ